MIILFFAISCKQTKLPDSGSLLMQIKEMSAMLTTELTFTKVIKHIAENAWYKIGKRIIIFEGRIKVKMGIDLNKINQEDIQIDSYSKKVSIKIPIPEIFGDINIDQINVEYEKISPLRNNFDTEERLKIQKELEKEIKSDIKKTNLSQIALANTRSVFDSVLRHLGFQTIVISFKGGN